MYKLNLIFLSLFFLINSVSSLANPLAVRHKGSLTMTLDVWPLMGNHHEYKVSLDWTDPPLEEIYFIVEHPFWNIKPKVQWSQNIRDNASATFPTPNQVSVSIKGVSANSSPTVPTGHLADLVFSATDVGFLMALQYSHLSVTPEPPIRNSPPIYPIYIKDIVTIKGVETPEKHPQVLTSVLINAAYTRARATVQNNSDFLCAEGMTLRFLTINGLPLHSSISIETELDSKGYGEMTIPFRSIPADNQYYDPTYAQFGLYCRDHPVAISDEIPLGSNANQEFHIYMNPIQSHAKEWILYH